MELDWYKCESGVWCELFRLDLDHEYLNGIDGVYILWCGTSDKSIITIGKGSIRKQLKTECEDIAVKAFENQGLYVTWAEVSAFKRKGVENYLKTQLKPKIEREPPKGNAIEVGLPW